MIDVYVLATGVVALVWMVWFDPWYGDIELPRWAPSSGVIRWGWTVGLVATGGAWITVSGSEARLDGIAGGLLWAQLFLALVWAGVFFRRRNARTGFTVICLHWSAIALAAAALVAIDLLAGLVVLPWLAFVTYLGAFNFFVWQLEPRP